MRTVRFWRKLKAIVAVAGALAMVLMSTCWAFTVCRWFLFGGDQLPESVRVWLVSSEDTTATNVCFPGEFFPDGHAFDSWVELRPGTIQVLVTEQRSEGDRCSRYAQGITGNQRLEVRLRPGAWLHLPGPEATPCQRYRQECDFVMTLDDDCCVRPVQVRDAP